MTLRVYAYDKCGTCCNAVKWLKSHDLEIEQVIPIFETPPSVTELKQLIADSGLEMKKFWNTSGEVYREMGLKDKLSSMTDEQKLELMASNGRLMKRPIVTDGRKVTVGFKESEYKRIWGSKEG